MTLVGISHSFELSALNIQAEFFVILNAEGFKPGEMTSLNFATDISVLRFLYVRPVKLGFCRK